MIHIGIDTINLNGKYFEALVAQEDEVHAGQELIRFDMAAIRAAGYSTQTMLIVTNSSQYQEVISADKGTADYERAVLSLKV